jgi:hypothetical protein
MVKDHVFPEADGLTVSPPGHVITAFRHIILFHIQDFIKAAAKQAYDL